jgi:hypothetical protein
MEITASGDGTVADRNLRQQERRREAFRRSLDDIDAGEIRARLADRRIRSAERIAIAEDVLRERDQAMGNGGAEGERAARSPRRAMNGGEGKGEEQAAPEGEGADLATEQAEGSYARQIGHQIGRMVGMGLGVVGLAAVALLVLRR